MAASWMAVGNVIKEPMKRGSGSGKHEQFSSGWAGSHIRLRERLGDFLPVGWSLVCWEDQQAYMEYEMGEVGDGIGSFKKRVQKYEVVASMEMAVGPIRRVLISTGDESLPTELISDSRYDEVGDGNDISKVKIDDGGDFISPNLTSGSRSGIV